MNDLIVIKNLSKNYDSSKNINVLNKLNFKFLSGKTYSIIGPSGSGKSTLLNLLSLIDTPTSGSIKIDNLNINFKMKENNDKIRSNNIGIIYQDNNLLPDFTILENVYLARLAINGDKNKALKDSKEIIEKVGLNKRINHFPSQISGGEAQRVAISRAIINYPKIILADEPTGSLDKENAKLIFKLLFQHKKNNRTIIFATHNRYFANMADCKIELLDGKMKIINGRIYK
tara:strand:+ start:591 stop:1280 length:690 start_codon:yes stop_codon:yes gene_type:complete